MSTSTKDSRDQLRANLPPELLDIEGAAAYLSVTERWMRRAVDEKRIEFIRCGRLIRFRKEALAQYLADNTVGAQS